MSATTTLQDLIEALVEETQLGQVLNGIDPDSVTASTITLADSYGSSPSSAADIPLRSPMLFTSPADGGTATASSTTTITDSSKAWTVDEWIGFVVSMGGWRATITDSDATSVTFAALDQAPTVGKYSIGFGSTFVSNYVPSTGVITMKPTLGTLNAAQVKPFSVVIADPVLRHTDRFVEAINRALQNKVYRWEPRPLTFVPDGDLQGTTVTDYWTAATNGTVAYATAQIFPAGGAVDAFGQAGVSRLLQLTSSAGGATSCNSNGIRVQLSAQLQSWYFLTAIRLVSGTGTASFVIRDSTNSANIAPVVSRGNDSLALETTTFGEFMICEGIFQMPATCAEIAFRPTLSAASMVMQMAPLIAFPLGTYQFPLPNRVRSQGHIGNVYCGYARANPGGLATIKLNTDYPLGHGVYSFGDHLTLSLDAPLTRAAWYEEQVYEPALIAVTDTTTAGADRVVKWAKFEVYDWLMRREAVQSARLESGALPPSRWRALRNAALREAQWSQYEPELMQVYGRR